MSLFPYKYLKCTQNENLQSAFIAKPKCSNFGIFNSKNSLEELNNLFQKGEGDKSVMSQENYS